MFPQGFLPTMRIIFMLVLDYLKSRINGKERIVILLTTVEIWVILLSQSLYIFKISSYAGRLGGLNKT